MLSSGQAEDRATVETDSSADLPKGMGGVGSIPASGICGAAGYARVAPPYLPSKHPKPNVSTRLCFGFCVWV